MKCKYKNPNDPLYSCDFEVDTEADKSVPSVITREANGQECLIAMFPSKQCEHGLCSYHARITYYKKLGIGKES